MLAIPASVRSFGELLLHLRTLRKLSLRELAAQIGCSAPHLHDVEHDRRYPTRLIPKLAVALHVPQHLLCAYDSYIDRKLHQFLLLRPQYVRALYEMAKGGVQ